MNLCPTSISRSPHNIIAMSQSKRWCYTLNNYTEDDIENIAKWNVKYSIYGKEICPSTGTLHLQGFVIFNSAYRFSAVKKLLSTAHWESTKGSSKQASDYCQKTDSCPTVFGNFPTPGKRTDLDKVCDLVKTGAPMSEITNLYPATYIRNYKGIAALSSSLIQHYHHDDVRGLWLVGSPGTGKSRYARSQFPNAFFKAQNKWFDGYEGEEAIILDDLDKGGVCLGHYLKIWSDRYACSGEIKGATVKLRHKTFVVTSNYSIQDLWQDDKHMVEAILRRFKVIKFPETPFM